MSSYTLCIKWDTIAWDEHLRHSNVNNKIHSIPFNAGMFKRAEQELKVKINK